MPDISSLFTGADVGAWYSPRDLTKMWTDTARTTHVANDGDLVGEQWSQGLGDDLWTNPSPSISDGGSGASGSYDVGTSTMTNSLVGVSSSYPRFSFNIGLVATDKYEVTAQLSGDIASIFQVRMAGSGSSNDLTYDSATGVITASNVSAVNYISFLTDGRSTFNITIDSIVVKKISSVARQQATAGLRPVYKVRSDGVAYLDYAGGKTLTLTGSSSEFKFLHDGTGGTLAAWLEWPANLASDDYIESFTSTSQTGIRLTKSSSVHSMLYQITHGVSGEIVVNSTIPYVAVGQPVLVRYSYEDTGTTNDVLAYKDSAVDLLHNQIQSFLPNTGNSFKDLLIVTNYVGIEYDLVIIDRTLDQTDSALVYSSTKDSVLHEIPGKFDLSLLLVGQSNMRGAGDVTSIIPPVPQDGVYTYTLSEEYKRSYFPVHDNVNQPVKTSPVDALGLSRQGPMMVAGKYLNNSHSQQVLLIPTAVGGTSVNQWNVPVDLGDRTTLFGASVYRYQQASRSSTTPIIVMYGHEANRGSASAEIDYVNGGMGTTAYLALESWLHNIRKHTNVKSPIIFCQLAGENVLADAEDNAAMGEVHRQIEQNIPNVSMVVTHDLERNASADDIHLSGVGQTALGDRIGKAIAQHILGAAVNGTGPRLTELRQDSTTLLVLETNSVLNTTVGDYGSLFRVYDNGVEATVSSANRGSNTTSVDIVVSAPLSGPVTVTYGHAAGPNNAARTDFVADADGLPLPLFGPLAPGAVALPPGITGSNFGGASNKIRFNRKIGR